MADDGLDKLPAMAESIAAGRSIYMAAYRPTERETLHDFRIAAELFGRRLRRGDVTNVRLLITYDTAPAAEAAREGIDASER